MFWGNSAQLCQSQSTHWGWCRWRGEVSACSSGQWLCSIRYPWWLLSGGFPQSCPFTSADARCAKVWTRALPPVQSCEECPQTFHGEYLPPGQWAPPQTLTAIAGPASLPCHCESSVKSPVHQTHSEARLPLIRLVTSIQCNIIIRISNSEIYGWRQQLLSEMWRLTEV